MGASGVLVFDDTEGQVVSASGGSEHTFVVLDDRRDVLVFDVDATNSVVEQPDDTTDFLLFEARTSTTETVTTEVDFLLVDAPPAPATVVLGETQEQVLVITPGGPPGQTGAPGPQGPAGPPGAAGTGSYFQEFGFTTPSTTWTIVHNQNSLALNVEALDNNGELIEGYVRYVDLSTVEIDWYYPTAGTARLFR